MDCASPVNLLPMDGAKRDIFTENLVGDSTRDVNLSLKLSSVVVFVDVKFDLRHGECNDSFIKRDGDGRTP